MDNPYSFNTYCEVPLASTAEALAKVQETAAAQRLWASETTLDDRLALVKRFMSNFECEKERIAADISGQMGKPYTHALGEIKGMYERCEGMMALAPEALAPEILPAKANFKRTIIKEPVGVVLCVAPWNFPLLTSVNCIVPAVLAGNGVIVKHSPRSPLCAEAFERAFLAAGAPPGLVSSLHCEHDSVHAVMRQEEVGFVSFTGSVAGGRAVYSSLAQHRFVDATLELGGKDAAYIAEDADMEAAVETLVDGAFFNAGQSCCGIERVYVHESRYRQFLEGASAELERCFGVLADGTSKLGDPMASTTAMGPMALPTAPGFLQGQVKDAVNKGAKILFGDGTPVTDASGKGRFFSPTLLAGCSHSMDVMVEESFGPVLGVMPVASDGEAIDRINDSKFGLTACVFTSNEDRAEKMGQNVSVGTFFMNRCDYLDPMLPWTGVKDTGKGISLSTHGFRGVTKLKGLHLKMDPAK